MADWKRVKELAGHLQWLVNDAVYKAPEQMPGCDEDLRRTCASLRRAAGIVDDPVHAGSPRSVHTLKHEAGTAQWTAMSTDGGELTIAVVVGGVTGTVVFSDLRDLTDLFKHVQVAIVQQQLRGSRGDVGG